MNATIAKFDADAWGIVAMIGGLSTRGDNDKGANGKGKRYVTYSLCFPPFTLQSILQKGFKEADVLDNRNIWMSISPCFINPVFFLSILWVKHCI